MNEPQKSETKTEALEREIKELEEQIMTSIDIESAERVKQKWLKKRVKLAQEELAELKEI